MNPVMQNVFGQPDGNCLQACVASIFNIKLAEVPNFMRWRSEWHDRLTEFCIERGLYPLHVNTDEPEGNLRGYHLMAVMTTRGILHSVVGYNGKMVHDPYPGGSEITEVQEYTVFVSLMRDV